MARRNNPREEQQRRAVALEAARIMAEQGVDDFLLAKRKAAERLMLGSGPALPGNAEIEAALREHQRLFNADHHAQDLRTLRNAAARMMRMLDQFKPRLVGSVLSGSATAHAEIQLHVFADRAEPVALRLEELGIRIQHAEKKFRYESERQVNYPSFKFVAGHHSIEVVVFPVDGIRQSPSSPVDGKPMARADLIELNGLLK